MSLLDRETYKVLYERIIDDDKFFDGLTEIQQDVITYLADGMTFREISLGDGKTQNQIKHIRNTVFRKLGYKINRGTPFHKIYEGILEESNKGDK